MTNATREDDGFPWNPSIRAFNDNTAQARIAARNAQLFAYGCLLVAALALGIACVAITQPKLVPYVISAQAPTNVASIGIAQPLSADQAALMEVTQYELAQFVEYWRFVAPADAADYQQQMINDYVQPLIDTNTGRQAATVVHQFYAAANPYDRSRSTLVQVHVDTPIPQTPTTFQLHWTETQTAVDGSNQTTTDWRGYATVTYHTPTADEAQRNPAGVTITTLSVQETSTLTTPQP